MSRQKEMKLSDLTLKGLSLAFVMISMLSLASDKPQNCTLKAFFVLPDGSTKLIANDFGILAIKLENKTANHITIEAFKAKGVEQLSESPMPARQSNVFPCYLTTFLIEFVNADGQTIHRDSPYLTMSGILHPEEIMTSLLRVRLPNSSGNFRVRVSGPILAKSGNFAFSSEHQKEKTESVGKLEAEIESVQIVGAELRSYPPPKESAKPSTKP
jgi:hypothetical protein